MKASELVTFVNNVIEQHGDIDVNAQIDMVTSSSRVTGFWVRLIPETGERVLVISHTYAQKQRFVKDD